MSQLAQLRQKISATRTTKKITQAIRLVSMSLYGRLDRQTTFLQTYTQNIQRILAQLAHHAPDGTIPLLSSANIITQPRLIVIVGASKGLCGSFNANLLRFLSASISTQDFQETQFIAIGQKIINFLHEQNTKNIIHSYKELASANFITLAEDLVGKIAQTNIPYHSIVFYSMHSSTFFLQVPKKTALTSAISQELAPTHETKTSQQRDIIWEQEAPIILEHLVARFVRSFVTNILFQSLRAEHAARFMAMDSSTNNAEKYLDQLILQYNKTRQMLITKEVAELSASFPSQSF